MGHVACVLPRVVVGGSIIVARGWCANDGEVCKVEILRVCEKGAVKRAVARRGVAVGHVRGVR